MDFPNAFIFQKRKNWLSRWSSKIFSVAKKKVELNFEQNWDRSDLMEIIFGFFWRLWRQKCNSEASRR